MTLSHIYTPVFLTLLRQDPQMLFVSGLDAGRCQTAVEFSLGWAQ